MSRVADPKCFDTDPDPTFHFDSDPELIFSNFIILLKDKFWVTQENSYLIFELFYLLFGKIRYPIRLCL